MGRELDAAYDENRNALLRVADADTPELARALLAAQKELRAKLAAVPDDDESYDAHRARAAYTQLDRTIRSIAKRTEGALHADLVAGAGKAQNVASKRLAAIVHAGARAFPGSVQPLRLDVAAVLAQSKRSLLGRFSVRAKIYSEGLAREMRRQLMTGIIKGESVDQMTKRVLRGTGLVRRLSGQRGKALDAMVAKPITKYKARARTIVRTELNNAYNTTQLDQIAEMEQTDPGWLVEWDAAHDWRVCAICRDLDLVTVPVGTSFPGGVDGPPIHPNDRCCVNAVRPEWSQSRPKTSVERDARIATPARAVIAPESANVEPPAPKKNEKRVEAARKAGEASALRMREIRGAVRSNLPADLHVAWDKEGSKFLKEEAARIKGVKDPINAASKISERFAEVYAGEGKTSDAYGGDRSARRLEIDAEHAEEWANKQERAYYEEMQRDMLKPAAGEVDEWGEPTEQSQDRDRRALDVAAPRGTDDNDDPPF